MLSLFNCLSRPLDIFFQDEETTRDKMNVVQKTVALISKFNSDKVLNFFERKETHKKMRWDQEQFSIVEHSLSCETDGTATDENGFHRKETFLSSDCRALFSKRKNKIQSTNGF